MNIVYLKQQAETRQVKVVFKNATNDHNTLFGGTAIQGSFIFAAIDATSKPVRLMDDWDIVLESNLQQ